jgi:MFS family permease
MFQTILYLFIVLVSYTNIALVFPNFDVIISDLNIQPLILGPWTLSPAALVGFIETAFLIAFAITILLYGYYTDKVNRKKLAYFGCSLWSFATIMLFFTPNYAYLLIFRIITALGVSCVAPIGFSIISDLVTSENRSKVLSFWALAFTIGSLIGAFVATSFEDWRVPFLLIGLLGLASTQLLLLVKTPPRAAKERAFQEIIGFQGYNYKYEIKRADIPMLWKRRTNFWIVVNFLDTIPTGIMVYWGIVFFKEHGFDPTTSVFLFVILGIAIFLGPPIFGWLGDRWFRRTSRGRILLCVICNYLSLIPIFIAVITPFSATDLTAAAFVVAMLAIGLLINGGIGPNWYSTFLDVNVPENRGTMLSLALMFDSIGKGIGPFITGLFLTLQDAFLWAIVIWLISSVFWLPALFSISKDINTVNAILDQRAKEIKIAAS